MPSTHRLQAGEECHQWPSSSHARFATMQVRSNSSNLNSEDLARFVGCVLREANTYTEGRTMRWQS
eukprot:3204722-Amphidinium_carterae.1